MKVLVCAILTFLVQLTFGFEHFEDSFMELNPLITQNIKSNEEVTEIVDEYTGFGLNSDVTEKTANYSNNIDTNTFNETEILVS